MRLTTPQLIHTITGDPLYKNIRFGKHGRSHAERVLLFANMLAAMIQSDNDVVLDMQALTIGALLHDCKKVEESSAADPDHGINSAKAAYKLLDELGLECDKEKVYDIVIRHCPPKGRKFDGSASFEAKALGDADKLDRFRFHSQGGPEPKFFQLKEYSISLMDISARVNGHWWRSFKRKEGG
jgi:HD superfamily phosphodiesterase